MINNLKILAVIPARGGSKSVPLKNLRKLNGVPLVEIAANVASEVKYIDRVIVSTDHKGIAEAAIKGGAEAPFIRPDELSGDSISDLQVLTHAILKMEEIDQCIYDIVLMLQPTSPLRTKQHIIDSLKILIEGNFDSVWSVSETDSKHHPLKQLKINNNLLEYYDNQGKNIIARQQLNKIYHRNGVVYSITRACLLIKKSTKGNKTGVLITNGNHISIDNEWDFDLIEFIQSKTYGNKN
tara:strand:+ start:200 stop:916 length:717 start_codon:yes stop_codon:yes gene_type:complete